MLSFVGWCPECRAETRMFPIPYAYDQRRDIYRVICVAGHRSEVARALVAETDVRENTFYLEGTVG